MVAVCAFRSMLRIGNDRANLLSVAHFSRYVTDTACCGRSISVAAFGCSKRLWKTPPLRYLAGQTTVCPNQHLTSNLVRLAVRSYVVDSTTQVTRDVLIYRYTQSRFFLFLSVFAVMQGVYFAQLAYYATQAVELAKPLPENANWVVRLIAGQSSTETFAAVFLGACSIFIVYAAFMFVLRYVHTIHLLRGGRQLKIITFAPFGRKRSLVVDVKDTCCHVGRKGGTTFIPIKVKNHSLFYLVDQRGEFTNPILFDYTVGMERRFQQ